MASFSFQQQVPGDSSARLAIIPDGAHGNQGMKGGDCYDRLVAAFIEAGQAEMLDVSCLGGMERPPFVVEEVRDDSAKASGGRATRGEGWLERLAKALSRRSERDNGRVVYEQ